MYGAEVAKVFDGDKISAGSYHGATRMTFQACDNSGTGALMLAAHRRARRIIMLGYDCKKTNGKTHHHGDHPKGLGNAKSMGRWQELFKRAALRLRHVQVVNASRETALTCFPRVTLEEALG